MTSIIKITELQGDGIGPELETAVARVMGEMPLDLEFDKVDWSVERREAEGRAAIDEGIRSLERSRLALKYPTVTATVSPNAILRRQCGFSVIYRPAISIPGVSSNFKENVNLHIVRVGTGGTYEDPGQLIGKHAAVSLRMVEREPCLHAANFAFELARSNGMSVTSSSKHTIQRVTDGLFESVVSEVAERYPYVEHRQELFDALLGKVIVNPEVYEVVLVLNEYGDFLSDLASGLVGSLGTGASGNFAFDDSGRVSMAMFDPAHGTAPDIAGQDLANPAAMLLAVSMLLTHIGEQGLSARLQNAVVSAIGDGQCTGDLGGSLKASEFTDEVIRRMQD